MGGDVDMEAVLTNWEKSSGITPAKVREAAKKFLKAVTDADGDDGDPEGGGGQGDETGNGKGGDLKPTKASGAKTFKLNELALAVSAAHRSAALVAPAEPTALFTPLTRRTRASPGRTTTSRRRSRRRRRTLRSKGSREQCQWCSFTCSRGSARPASC